MECWIRLIGREWIGPYPSPQAAQDDAKVLGLTHGVVVTLGKVSPLFLREANGG